MTRTIKTILLFLSIAALTACGGGGSGTADAIIDAVDGDPVAVTPFVMTPEKEIVTEFAQGDTVIIGATVKEDQDGAYVALKTGDTPVYATKVSFYIDNVSAGSDETPTYRANTWDTSGLNTGSYTIRVVVNFEEDGESKTINETITVTVTTGEGGEGEGEGEPDVSNVKMLNETLKTGGTAVIEATINSVDALDTVEILVDNANEGSMSKVSGNTYRGTWKPSAEGTFSIKVKATDIDDDSDTSSALSVTVTKGDGNTTGDWTAPPAKAFHRVSNFGESENVSGKSQSKTIANYTSGIKMYLHIPADLPKNAPIVLALHGCQQTATGFKTDTGWTTLADKYKFIAIFAEMNKTQSDSNASGNQYGCFNWGGYYGYNFERNLGDSASLMQMIKFVQDSDLYQGGNAYVTGLSAGGGMTSAMGAFYPDKITAIAPMSGPSFGCATFEANGSKTNNGKTTENAAYACQGITSSFTPLGGCGNGIACMSSSKKRPQDMWAKHVTDMGPENYNGPYPRVMTWSGTKDQLVDPAHINIQAEQWTKIHGTSMTTTNSTKTLKDGGRQHTFDEYSKDGEPVVATVMIQNMGHGIATDPGSAEDQGGAGSASDCYGLFCQWKTDVDIHSSYYTAKWWGLLSGGESNMNKISVSITSPTNNASIELNSKVTIKADASDDEFDIMQVEFEANGEAICTDISAPYECEWNTAGIEDGTQVELKVTAINNTVYDSKSTTAKVWVGEKGFNCTDHSATLTDHATEGRAVRTSSGWGQATYTLKGSGDTEEGTFGNISTPFDVRETAEDYFEFGKCP